MRFLQDQGRPEPHVCAGAGRKKEGCGDRILGEPCTGRGNGRGPSWSQGGDLCAGDVSRDQENRHQAPGRGVGGPQGHRAFLRRGRGGGEKAGFGGGDDIRLRLRGLSCRLRAGNGGRGNAAGRTGPGCPCRSDQWGRADLRDHGRSLGLAARDRDLGCPRESQPLVDQGLGRRPNRSRRRRGHPGGRPFGSGLPDPVRVPAP